MLENMPYVTKALATVAMARTFLKAINALQALPSPPNLSLQCLNSLMDF
jgi:hypothetical protein